MASLAELEQAEVTQLSVRQRVEAFFKGTDIIKQFAAEVMVPILCCQLSLNEQEEAVTGVYYRMYLWMLSLVSMNSRVHFQGAAAAARTLFELLLDEKLLVTDTNGSMIAKFHAFPEVERFRLAKAIVGYNDTHRGSGIDDVHQRQLISTMGKEQAVNQQASQHWGTTKSGNPYRPQHWSGLKVKDRAKRLGPQYEELYIESYPLLSWSIHSGSVNYAGLNEDAIESCFGLSHSIAQRCFIEATTLITELMHIKEAVEGFNDILKELRLTPGKVIVKEQARIIDEARQRTRDQGTIIVP